MTKVSTNLGKVATTPKGEYNSATTYLRLDVVLYNGSSYVCLKQSVGNLPTNTEYWQLMASKGDKGDKPIKGVDYFTQEDIASLNIPEYTSDLVNDSSFIDNTVNNLINYYLKNETYTKAEVNTLIGNIQQFHYEVVQTLPQTGETNILYLVPKSTSQTNNYYDEYVYSNGWEKIGDTEIDLSNYVTITMLNQALADYTTTANLTTLLAGKQNTLTAGTNITIDANNVISASSNQDIYVINVDDYTNNNPFIFAEHPLGRYFFKSNNFQTYLKCKGKSNDISVSTIYNVVGLSYIDYTVDINNVTTITVIGTLQKNFAEENDGFYIQQTSIKYTPTSNTTISIDTGYAKVYFETTGKEQTITAKKTFNVLPESSITPTTNNQLVNKQYVDNAVASGGNCVYLGETSQYTQQNPLDLDELPIGKYILGIDSFSNNNSYVFYIKYTYNNTEYVKQVFYNMSGYIPMVKFLTFSYDRKGETQPFNLGTVDYLGIKERLEVYKAEVLIKMINDDLTTNNASYYQIKCVNTNTAQDITALKTFYTIPQQSDTTAPTNDKEFTNKKYVDDQISNAVGNINTILATLTTPSGNGGN